MGRHGRILVGNKAFEFYNDRNPADFVQIPWGEIRQYRAILSKAWLGRKLAYF